MLTILATDLKFYTHAGILWLIIGILFTIIGYFCGWLIWRHCRSHASRIQSEIDRLERERDAARGNLSSLEERIQELEPQS